MSTNDDRKVGPLMQEVLNGCLMLLALDGKRPLSPEMRGKVAKARELLRKIAADEDKP